MAKYIISILQTQAMIAWSWGCCRFTTIENGLMFHVQGYLLNGWVKVIYVAGRDTFEVHFLNNKKEVIKKIEDVYIDSLVDIIDFNVENNGSFDYDKRVKDQYSL